MPTDKTSKGGIDLSSHSGASFRQGKNYLLAIGITEYSQHSRLPNAVKDVEDITSLLIARYAFQREAPFARFLLNKDATERAIRKSLHDLCGLLRPDDRVLIFFSGHGHLDPRTKLGFWIPAEAEKNDVSTFMPNSTVRDYIKVMPCRHVLLISDSCFSGELLVRDASRRTEAAFHD